MRDLARLPKAHLHLHLDGAIRAQTLHELCARSGTAPPALPVGKRYASFDVFMKTIAACHDALASPGGLRRIIGEVIEDAAADGAVWVEVSLWPGLFGGRLGPDRESLLLALDAGLTADSRLGVGFGLMVAANRHAGPEAATATAQLAVDLASEGVVSFGLDGDEAAFPPAPFASAFAVAKSGGLLSTPHAGELLGPESVAVALDLLQADRILHGVRAVDDATLLTRLRGERGPSIGAFACGSPRSLARKSKRAGVGRRGGLASGGDESARPLFGGSAAAGLSGVRELPRG